MLAPGTNTNVRIQLGEAAIAFAKLTHDVHHVGPDEWLSARKSDLVHAFFHEEPRKGQDLLCGQQVGLGGQWDALLGHAVLACKEGRWRMMAALRPVTCPSPKAPTRPGLSPEPQTVRRDLVKSEVVQTQCQILSGLHPSHL